MAPSVNGILPRAANSRILLWPQPFCGPNILPVPLIARAGEGIKWLFVMI